MSTGSNPFGSPTEDDDDDILDVEGLDEVGSKFQVPSGIHEAKLISAIKETSKNSGKPMVTITVALTGQMDTEQGFTTAGDGEHGGKEFKMWCSLVPAALFKVKELAEALDLPMENGRLKVKLKDLVGLQCLVQMEDREYEGRTSSSVKRMRRHPDGPEA